MKIGVFSPVLVVTKTLEQHFGFEGYHRLGIHAIDVDTQKRDEETMLVEQIDVTIRLDRPGLLIGKAGKDIYAVEKLLSENFGKRVKIHIVEVKCDINKPIPYY
jgi:ribosomal protein S3